MKTTSERGIDDVLTRTVVGHLEKIVIKKTFNDDGATASDLEMTLRSGLHSAAKRTQVRCKSVTELHVGDLVSPRVLQLCVYDISNRGLEELHFRVVDEEGLAVSFNCVSMTLED